MAEVPGPVTPASQPHTHALRQSPQLPARVTLPLLTLITQQSLDEDYLHVAERKATGGVPSAPRGRPHRTAALVVAVFGIMATTAAVQTSRNASVDDASRATLISQINAKRGTLSRLQDAIVRARELNTGLQDQLTAVTRTEQSAVARTERLEVRTGFVPVTGQGVRITVDDAPDGDETQKVKDEDLALLVDGLWTAGAEAISINGQRLTALSGIRNASVATNVNGNPLAPPYTVLAIGDTRTLQANLLDSSHGLQFFQLAEGLGFPYELHNEDSVTLPAAPEKLLRLRAVRAGTATDNQRHKNQEARP
jgi:uncharacterized protein YlxW (UPF0749 family)